MSQLFKMMPKSNEAVLDEQFEAQSAGNEWDKINQELEAEKTQADADAWDQINQDLEAKAAGADAWDWSEQDMAKAPKVPFRLRSADGSDIPAFPREEALARLHAMSPDHAAEVLEISRRAAKAAMHEAILSSSEKVPHDTRRDFVANVEGALMAAHLASARGIRFVPAPEINLEVHGIRMDTLLQSAWEKASVRHEAEEKRKEAPQARAVPANTSPSQEEEKEKKEAPQASGQEPENGDLENKKPAQDTLDPTVSGYRLEMPAQDGEQVIKAGDVVPALKALTAEVKAELDARRKAFIRAAVAAAFKESGVENPSDADVERLTKTMNLAYLATRVARAKLGHDETSPVRARIEGSPVLDEVLAQELAREVPAPSAEAESAAPLPVAATSPSEQAEAELMTGASGGFGVIENGDPEPEIPMEHELSVADHMERLGFPKRPKSWPVVMAWPMQPDFDMLIKSKASREAQEEYLRGMREMQARMLQRAEEINEYILKHNDPRIPRGSLVNRKLGIPTWSDYGARRHLKRSSDDLHYGIRWASLLDDKTTRQASNLVRAWAHNTATTNDGGVVVAHRDAIRFKEITPQSVQLAIQESMARGWSTMKMKGDRKFAMAAIEAAKQANVQAEIIEFYGPWNLYKRRHTVMPTPPGATNAQPRVETQNVGAAPTDANARKPLTDSEVQQDIEEAAAEKITLAQKEKSIRELGNLGKKKGAEPDPSSMEVIQADEDVPIEWDLTPEGGQDDPFAAPKPAMAGPGMA
ncbi:hypothetical protein [Leisingera caerulea]|uniref:hypothetical protein n=1 Tax=Leisingera caerulea TaxID=506591 RepID=UPI0004073351|nr:hypothetical protein [Leisingera caerulea]